MSAFSQSDRSNPERGTNRAGERSVAKRVLRAAAPGLSNPAIGRIFAEADTLEELHDAMQRASAFEALQELAGLIMIHIRTVEASS